MLNNHNTATTSLKGLVRCKTAVKALIDETLSLSVAFDVFRTAADETGVPVDPQALEEPEAPPDAADSLEGGREGDECHPPGGVPQGVQRIEGRSAMEEKMIPARADSRLTEVLSSLHRAYELFNRWEESSSEGQFYDENIETVDKVSEGFGLLESDLARLISDKMLFDLEMEYRQLQ